MDKEQLLIDMNKESIRQIKARNIIIVILVLISLTEVIIAYTCVTKVYAKNEEMGVVMNQQNLETKHKIQRINSVKDFNTMLDSVILSSEEKQILQMHYIEKKPLSYIGDTLGMSDATIKRKHRKILNRLSSYF